MLVDLTKYERIVLVGADGTGKTTISRDLESIGYRYIKSSALDGNDKIQCALNALSTIFVGERVIFDRFYFPDDLIYSNLIKGTENNLVLADWKEVSDKLNELNFTIVYAFHDVDVIKSRFRSRGDEFIDESQLDSIMDGYSKLIPIIAEQNKVVYLDLRGTVENVGQLNAL